MDYDTRCLRGYYLSTIILGIIFALIEKFYFGENILNYFIGLLISALVIFLISKLTGAIGSGDIEIHAIAEFFRVEISNNKYVLSFIIGGVI
ncbi:MAG: hypothetical protein ACLU4S_09555 [Clostridium perfringens]